MNEKEEGSQIGLDFQKLKKIASKNLDVVPVVVQHASSREVLMVAYLNEEALKKSQTSGYAVFWSTSRNTLWEKGSSSGNRLKLESIYINCEQNSLVFMVHPETDGVCHTHDPKTGSHRPTCYYRRLENNRLVAR